MYPRLSTMTLALSTSENQGFNSSALAIGDSLGSALSLATTGIVFAAFAASGSSFAAVFAFAGLIAVLAIVVSPRVTVKKPDGTALGSPSKDLVPQVDTTSR